MRLAPLAFVLALTLPAPALADTGDCAQSILRDVARQLPRIHLSDLDPRQLSCSGLTQVYFILQDNTRGFGGTIPASFRQRQRVETVFRREGLTR